MAGLNNKHNRTLNTSRDRLYFDIRQQYQKKSTPLGGRLVETIDRHIVQSSFPYNFDKMRFYDVPDNKS